MIVKKWSENTKITPFLKTILDHLTLEYSIRYRPIFNLNRWWYTNKVIKRII
jgi:hypothetical protein